MLAVHSLRSYLKLIYEYELHSLPNKKVSGAKDHGENYIKVRPTLSAIFCIIVYCNHLPYDWLFGPNFLSYQNDWENYRAYLAVADKNKAAAVFKGCCTD